MSAWNVYPSAPVPATWPDLVRRFEQAITPATKVMHFCHITNLTGQVFLHHCQRAQGDYLRHRVGVFGRGKAERCDGPAFILDGLADAAKSAGGS